MSTKEQQTKPDGGASVSTAGLGGDTELLAAYAFERGLDSLTVEQLIGSHRYLIDELNRASRQEWRDALDNAIEQVKTMTLDATWIKLEKLRDMTVQELANLIGEE